MSEVYETRLLDEYEAANVLGVSVYTLRSWRWKRKGPPYCRIESRAIRYPLDELMRYIEAARIEPAEA